MKEKLKIHINIFKYILPFLILVLLFIFAMNFTIKSNESCLWYYDKMHLKDAGKYVTDTAVKVAIIDSGVDEIFVDDPKYKIVDTYNAVDQSQNVTDCNGHGTFLISILKENERGYDPISSRCELSVIKVMDDENNIKVDYLIEGINYAIKLQVDVINLSVGIKNSNDKLFEVINNAVESGIIVLAAVGDTSEKEFIYPALYEGVIAVTAQSELGVPYRFSNSSKKKSLLIPGENIVVRDYICNETLDKKLNGSSYATIIASGIIANILTIKNITGSECFDMMYKNIEENKYLNVKKLLKGLN